MNQKVIVKLPHVFIWFIALLFYLFYIAPDTAISRQAADVADVKKVKPIISRTSEEKNSSAKILLNPEELIWLKAHPDIQLGAPTSYPPLVIKNAKGPHTGMLVDLFELISQRLNTNIRLHIEDPWSSVQEKAKNRNIDGLASGGRSASRDEYLNPTDTLFSSYYYIFARTNADLHLKSVKDLEGMRIGYKKADTPVKSLLDKYSGVTAVPYRDNVAMTRGLMNKDVDVLVGWISYDFWRRDKLQGSVDNILLATDNPLDSYIHIRNDWPELIPILNKVLASIRQNELPKIMDKWFIERPRLPVIPKIRLTKKEQDWLAKKQTIRVRVTNYPPYMVQKEDAAPEGIAIDHLNLIAQRTGIKLEFISSGKTFQEALAGLKNKQGPDLMPVLVHTPERQQFILFSKNYIKSPYMIFTRPGEKNIITSLDDISHREIALVRGSALHETMKKEYPDIKLKLFGSDIKALEAVADQKADAYVGNLVMASYFILNKGLYNLKIAAPSPFGDQVLSIGSRSDWPELNSIIEKGLATITEVEKKEIRNRYISVRYDQVDTSAIIKWVLIVIVLASSIILLFIFLNRSLKKQVAVRTSELKSSEEQYRYLFENMVQGAFYQSSSGQLSRVNFAALEMFGLSYDQFVGKTSKDPQWRVVHEDGTDFPGEDHPSMVALKTGAECRDVVAGIYNVNKQDYTWVSITAVPQFKKDEKQPYQVFVTMHDITERKQSENLLQKSEKEFRSTLNNLVAGVVVHSSDTSVLFSNPEAAKLLGLTKDQILRKEAVDPAWQFVHEDLSVMQVEQYPVSMVLSTKRAIHDSVLGIKRPDRKDITWVIVNAIPIISDDGNIDKVIVNFIDYTDRKKTSEYERASKAFLNNTLNNIGDPVFVKDYQHKLLIVNDAFCTMFGRLREEVLGKTLAENVPQDQQDHFMKIDRQVLTDGRENVCEELLSIKDKKTLTILTKKTRYINKNGDKFLIGVIRDITERKFFEEERAKLATQLYQSQKMETIGTLAGGIAHDFNNILFPIIGYTELIIEDISDDSPMGDSIKEIYTAALRARDLVKQILTFARQDNITLKLIKMAPVINEALKLIRATVPTTIDIRHDIENDCGIIKADPSHIHQIVMNLATNAYHAMQDKGGELTVNLKEIVLGEHDVVGLGISPGSYACLTVADTGVGMNKSILAKAFDPFFTTKEQGKGTGMGLSVVHGIIKNAGGNINVYSEIGKGSQFNVYLPVVKNSFEQHELQAKELIKDGTEQILLVDDEKAILKMEKQLLERLGYQVVSCNSSLEALEIFSAAPDKFDLVITDMTMPNMSGDKLAGEMIKLRPDVSILLCTGFSEGIPKQTALSTGIKGFLMKPIVKADLSKKIREVLDA